ncbi:hypothetical protein KKF34_10935 [Myxococcota bacterium]|nr:hypothetical protein [Myxococcota bacterium]MBU1382795.1 hypothetical protein [Myxococcota bacterium]MBU1497382.1 hypothetical protein [Myxococcota bacterium]
MKSIFQIVLMVFVFSCSSKSTENKNPPVPNTTNNIQPMALKNPDGGSPNTKVTKPDEKPDKAPKPDTKRPDRFVDHINRMNNCFKRSVETVRKEIEKDVHVMGRVTHGELKKLGKICEKNLIDIINTYDDMTVYYQEFMLASAAFLDVYFVTLENLVLPKEAPGKLDLGSCDKKLVDSYNKRALKNNDFVGVAILETRPPQEKSTVDLRTYGDEAFRMGDFIIKEIHKWNISHSFDIVPGNDRPSWMFHMRREFVAIKFLSDRILRKINYFKTIDCIKGFATNMKADEAATKNATPPRTCTTVKVKSENFIKSVNAWIIEWKTQVTGGMKAYPVVNQGFKEKTEKAFSTVKSLVSTLPPPVN